MNDLITDLLAQATRDTIEKLSVGAAIMYENKILILKRRVDDFMPNIYELPGGGLENDESLLDALDREILEETNCMIDKVLGYIGYIDFLSAKGLKTRRFNFLVCPKLPIDVRLSEHESYEWILPKDAPLYNITNQTRRMISILDDLVAGGTIQFI